MRAPGDRGQVLMLVVICMVILSIVGVATLYLTGQQEIAARSEISASQADYVGDAAIEWGKVWISSQCISRNRFPENVSGNRQFFRIAQLTLGGRGSFAAGILPDAANTVDVASPGNSVKGEYVITTTATISSGIIGTRDTLKSKSIRIRLSRDGFSPSGSMLTPRKYHTGTLLPNGRVLIAGGTRNPGGGGILSSAELYDPDSGTFSPTGSMGEPRKFHEATPLPDGTVLVTGGVRADGGGGMLSSAEIYDPATGTFSPTAGPMAYPRDNHTATWIPSIGKVLIVGGDMTGGGSAFRREAELYDPNTRTFSPTGTLSAGRFYHSATLLNNGRVLIAGGWNNGWEQGLSSAELYDPATGGFSSAGSMAAGRHSQTATLLPGGKVLLTLGFGGAFLRSGELYDPATNSFSATRPLSTERDGPTAMLIPALGKVLIGGGPNTPELYDPATGTFSATAVPMGTWRCSPSVTLFPDGRVLIAGGYNDTGVLSSAELYPTITGRYLENSYIEQPTVRRTH